MKYLNSNSSLSRQTILDYSTTCTALYLLHLGNSVNSWYIKKKIITWLLNIHSPTVV